METQYRVLLYYKFVPVDNHEQLAAEHLEYCKNLGVLGRILIAPEGINGTLSGTFEQTEAYMNYLRSDLRFADTEFKIDTVDVQPFHKIFVRAKAELVTFRLEDDVKPYEMTGKYLNAEEFYKALKEEEVIVIDGRTDYEYEVGHFHNAICPPVASFREFPEWIRSEFGDKKHKKILTYCTGGIRCEKLTAFMVKEGFTDVYQLEGGIVKYGKDEKVRGALWEGLCYVFDERITVPINHTDEGNIVVGRCYHCGTETDTYINCANMYCNRQHLTCEKCLLEHEHCCSDTCKESTHKKKEYVDYVVDLRNKAVTA
ncbi:MAG: rhodanese-related sulfurtransferase [Ignavibacteriaceae bacterium]|jgi:UPF0176 protein|nr:rhodanese-related sulfurtransferase [Ignavibacteriaceae bacterium]